MRIKEPLEFHFLDLEIESIKNRRRVEYTIFDLLSSNHSRWVISETVALFWNRGWNVNKIHEYENGETVLIEHFYIEEELGRAIEHFIEIAQFDKIGDDDLELEYGFVHERY